MSKPQLSYYTLEHAIVSPRDQTISWVWHDNYTSLTAAKADAKQRIKEYPKSKWRILLIRQEWSNENS